MNLSSLSTNLCSKHLRVCRLHYELSFSFLSGAFFQTNLGFLLSLVLEDWKRTLEISGTARFNGPLSPNHLGDEHYLYYFQITFLFTSNLQWLNREGF